MHYFYRIVCLLTDFVSSRIYFYLFFVFFEYAEDIVLRERYVQFFFNGGNRVCLCGQVAHFGIVMVFELCEL